jgi:hypothetical protein
MRPDGERIIPVAPTAPAARTPAPVARLGVVGGVGGISPSAIGSLPGHIPVLLCRLRWAGSVQDSPHCSHIWLRSSVLQSSLLVRAWLRDWAGRLLY